MPILFLILADRLGVTVSLSTAPGHTFIRYVEPSGQTVNLETTSGALPARDAWIRHLEPISDRAVESGLYLATLTRRETVALMADTVTEYLMGQRRYEEAIAVSEAVIENYPRNGDAMVHEAAGYAWIEKAEFADKYPSPNSIPPELLSRYQMLNAKGQAAWDAAAALGWEPVEAPKNQ